MTARLIRVVDLAFECLRQKINGGRIRVENEASLQLQFAAILKTVGELLEIERDEYFSIELEKPVLLAESRFAKSGSDKAKIDVYCSYTNPSKSETHACAIELKFFKRLNHREPNNRYDVFRDIQNLERYGGFADCCFLVVGTDHDHYATQDSYSPDTADFDFRHRRNYEAGKEATYRTSVPYGPPIALKGSYAFEWNTVAGGLHFLKLAVTPYK